MYKYKQSNFLSKEYKCKLLAVIFIMIVSVTCSSCGQNDLIKASATAEIPASTAISTEPPLLSEETEPLFEEGKYIRDEYCGRVFDYHQITFGAITIALADNLDESVDMEVLAREVFEQYGKLSENSLAPMDHPLTVYVILDPMNGGCYSRDSVVFVAPDGLDSKYFYEALLGAGTGISEYWVMSGLTALALGEQPDQEMLKAWYEETDDLDAVGLFYARFLEEWASEEEIEIARQSAASLIQYALEDKNIPIDQLAEKVDNEVRTLWLASLGVDRAVTYPYDGHFVGFTYGQSNDCSILVRTDSMNFCLNRLPDQDYFYEISQAEFLIDHAYYGRIAIVDYLLSEAPSISHMMDPHELIEVDVRKLDYASGRVNGNKVSINQAGVYFDILHDIIHTFNWVTDAPARDEVWQIEGMNEYLGKLLPLYPQTEKLAVYQDLNGRMYNNGEEFTGGGITVQAGTSYWYMLDPEQVEAAKAWYLAQGGQIEPEESVDPLLYAHAVAFATIYRDAYPSMRSHPLGMRYQSFTPGEINPGQEGLELSTTQAASFVAYLCDTYTLDRVLAVFITNAEDGLLDGKTYTELKAEWQTYLMENGEGIAIPGQP